jgi:hypothetical protein
LCTAIGEVAALSLIEADEAARLGEGLAGA